MTQLFECGLCGAMTRDLKVDSLHRAVCPPCVEHNFLNQWGKCGTCGHAIKASCHEARGEVTNGT